MNSRGPTVPYDTGVPVPASGSAHAIKASKKCSAFFCSQFCSVAGSRARQIAFLSAQRIPVPPPQCLDFYLPYRIHQATCLPRVLFFINARRSWKPYSDRRRKSFFKPFQCPGFTAFLAREDQRFRDGNEKSVRVKMEQKDRGRRGRRNRGINEGTRACYSRRLELCVGDSSFSR